MQNQIHTLKATATNINGVTTTTARSSGNTDKYKYTHMYTQRNFQCNSVCENVNFKDFCLNFCYSDLKENKI